MNVEVTNVKVMNVKEPLVFVPRFQDYIWGGRNLATRLGRTIPDGIIAESWEISAHPSAPTVVESGSFVGRSLPELLHSFGAALVGRRGQWAVERGQFPLLIKLLDANRALSVQVHPDDAYAGIHENGELGKTEMWYVLHAEPGAQIICGVRAGVDRQRFAEAVATGDVEACLHRVPVKAGDAVLIPAGTVHAILEGIVLAEVQQSSNTTYRVYDWNRVGADGEPRELHLEKALDVIDWNRVEPGLWDPRLLAAENGYTRYDISSCQKFVVERVQFEDGSCFEGHLDGETFEAWGVLEGKSTFEWSGSPSGVGMTQRDTMHRDAVSFTLLPSQLGVFSVTAEGPVTALRIYLPASGSDT